MNLQILATNMSNHRMYDITEIVIDPSWTTALDSQPGKFEFSIIEDATVFLHSGDLIEANVDGKSFFKGKVFTRKKKNSPLWQIVAYDSLRYLKNEDTIVFDASSVSTRFKKICETQGIPYQILDPVSYHCPAAIMDNKTYFSMLENALEDTRLNAGGMRYCIRDNAGRLVFSTLNRLITKLVVGDQSLLTDYNYQATIDQAANAVKVIREDANRNTREIYTAIDAKNIEKWGRLQIVENVSDAELNQAQLQQQANALLRENNQEVKTISLSAIGSMEISAGSSFILRLSDLHNESMGNDQLALVTRCTHSLGKVHTMDLEVEVVT